MAAAKTDPQYPFRPPYPAREGLLRPPGDYSPLKFSLTFGPFDLLIIITCNGDLSALWAVLPLRLLAESLLFE